jgi:hypothetical protein
MRRALMVAAWMASSVTEANEKVNGDVDWAIVEKCTLDHRGIVHV